MKQTLLQLTQEVMSAMDSDEVNSIVDTTESLQVARIIRQAYYDLIDDLDPPEHYLQFELNASTDSTKPVMMVVPDDISKVIWVRYDCHDVKDTTPLFNVINFLEKDEFLKRMYLLRTSDSNVGTFNITTVDNSTMPIYFYTDRAPQYYTCWDDKTVIFDAYDNTVDSTLQKDKTVCYGKKTVTFNLDDNTTPDLDDSSFQRLLNESKNLAFAELKQVNHTIADRNAKRSRNRSFKNKFRVIGQSDFEQLPSFGRK